MKKERKNDQKKEEKKHKINRPTTQIYMEWHKCKRNSQNVSTSLAKTVIIRAVLCLKREKNVNNSTLIQSFRKIESSLTKKS